MLTTRNRTGFRPVRRYRVIVAGALALVLLPAGCWHRWIATQSYQMIPVSAFRLGAADDDTWDFDNIATRGGFGWISGGSAPYDVRLYAPVILPHGATVTELTAYYFDRATSDISKLDLSLGYQGTGANLGMAHVSVTTTGSENLIMSQSDSSISNPQIDASVNRVWLVLSMTVTAPSVELRFFGARITYEESRSE